MGTDFRIYDLTKGQLVYVDYKQAIRQAKYVGCRVNNRGHNMCGGNGIMMGVFEIAGVGQVEWELDSFIDYKPKVYYSLRDAKSCVNVVKPIKLSVEKFNAGLAKYKCEMDPDIGNLRAWVWCKTHPEHHVIVRYNYWSALWVDNHIEQLLMADEWKPLNLEGEFYRTKEECLANNEASVVTF